ncbi:MAG: DNA-binding NtrC family response regulator [Sulfurimonas sp.]|jgi:DNA-binding NtrC family response regulator|uniref:hypothetical protein n=1 Tax=Sulfurimonas sp. TaxID=2022749 RepID=UPI0039E5015F
MNTNKKWNILFIKEDKSLFDSDTKMLTQLFNKVDKAQATEEVLSLIDTKEYDIVIGDISVDAEDVVLLKEIKEKKPQQTIFALVSPKDTDKLYKIANFDINAFELIPEQFDQALEEIANFNPYEER